MTDPETAAKVEILAHEFDMEPADVVRLLGRLEQIQTGQYSSEPGEWDNFERERWFERWNDADAPPVTLEVKIEASIVVEVAETPWAVRDKLVEIAPSLWSDAIADGLSAADFGGGDEFDWIAGLTAECQGMNLEWTWLGDEEADDDASL